MKQFNTAQHPSACSMHDNCAYSMRGSPAGYRRRGYQTKMFWPGRYKPPKYRWSVNLQQLPQHKNSHVYRRVNTAVLWLTTASPPYAGDSSSGGETE